MQAFLLAAAGAGPSPCIPAQAQTLTENTRRSSACGPRTPYRVGREGREQVGWPVSVPEKWKKRGKGTGPLARPQGLEPRTSRSVAGRSIQLSYGRAVRQDMKYTNSPRGVPFAPPRASCPARALNRTCVSSPPLRPSAARGDPSRASAYYPLRECKRPRQAQGSRICKRFGC